MSEFRTAIAAIGATLTGFGIGLVILGQPSRTVPVEILGWLLVVAGFAALAWAAVRALSTSVREKDVRIECGVGEDFELREFRIPKDAEASIPKGLNVKLATSKMIRVMNCSRRGTASACAARIVEIVPPRFSIHPPKRLVWRDDAAETTLAPGERDYIAFSRRWIWEYGQDGEHLPGQYEISGGVADFVGPPTYMKVLLTWNGDQSKSQWFRIDPPARGEGEFPSIEAVPGPPKQKSRDELRAEAIDHALERLERQKAHRDASIPPAA